jgi:hypothetical protein
MEKISKPGMQRFESLRGLARREPVDLDWEAQASSRQLWRR